MRIYQELKASPRIVERVECIWLAAECGADAPKRVVPDGCADIIYTRQGGEATLIVVGPMTHYEDFRQDGGSCSVGVRFRPGMWGDVLRVCGPDVTNRLLPLDDLWGKRGQALMRSLEAADEPLQFAKLLSDSVPAMEGQRSPLQQAIGALESSYGLFSLDRAAREAGFSTRQFRRRCLQATGLSPKLLARVLRFRHATELVVSMSGQHAGLAFECGYTDQSHLIAEFQEFAGQTPCEMAAAFART